MENIKPLKVKILKRTASRITILLIPVNRRIPVPKEEFHERVEKGIYEVVDDITQTDDEDENDD